MASQQDELLALVVLVLGIFLAFLTVSLVILHLLEVCVFPSSPHRGCCTVFRRQKAGIGSEKSLVPQGSFIAGKSPLAERVPGIMRQCIKVLLICWAITGIFISLYLVVNFLQYIEDDALLEEQLEGILSAEPTAGGVEDIGLGASNSDTGLSTLDGEGNATAGFSIFSEVFIIPDVVVEEVIEVGFSEVLDDNFTFYGVDWIGDRCRSGNCIPLEAMLLLPVDAFSIYFVAAPKGTNPDIIMLLLVALFFDAFTFVAFAGLITYRMRHPDSMGLSTDVFRRTLLFEGALMVASLIVLIVLAYLAVTVPLTYEAIAFLSPVASNAGGLGVSIFGGLGDARVTTPIVAKTGFTTEKSVFDYVWDINLGAVEWCPGPVITGLLTSDTPQADALQVALVTGPMEATTPGCVASAGEPQRFVIADAGYYQVIIDFVHKQIINQGVVIDALLILMDMLVLSSSYLFLIF